MKRSFLLLLHQRGYRLLEMLRGIPFADADTIAKLKRIQAECACHLPYREVV